MNALIPISQTAISGEPVETVDARDLHAFLQVKTAFNDWIARRISEYQFVEGQDFYSFLSESGGGRPSKGYALTIDMAKELSMVERTDRGREARQYFIECERRLKSASKAVTAPETIGEALVQMAEGFRDLERRQIETDNRVSRTEQQLENYGAHEDYRSVKAYAALIGVRLRTDRAKELGQRAAQLSRAQGYKIGKQPDDAFGHVNTYHRDILERVFDGISGGSQSVRE